MNFIYRIITIFLTAFCLQNAVTGQITATGKIISYIKVRDGIKGKTTNCFFEVKAYDENTIRVRISRKEIKDNFSYALLNSEPTFKTSLNITDHAAFIELVTTAIVVVIEKEPSLRIIFKNHNGEIINEDLSGPDAGTSFIKGQVSSYKTLQEGERFVGLGEVLGNLDKRGNGFTLNNTDTYKYGDPRLSMYSSIPFYIGIHHRQVYGLFYHNTWKSFFNFGLSTPFVSITADGANADYFFFYDSSINWNFEALHCTHRSDAFTTKMEYRVPAITVQLLPAGQCETACRNISQKADPR